MGDDSSAKQIMGFLTGKKSSFWEGMRERKMLSLFHDAVKRVPAYGDFLKKWHVNPAKIKTIKDFKLVPPVSKENYLRQYPLEKLMRDGSLNGQFVFTATSGSTGEPFYFPRSRQLDWESSIAHELFLRQDSKGVGVPTLVLVCFGMGVWIGGVITYKAFETAAQRGKYHISILTPGINKGEIFKALKLLAPHYDRVILAGYPPFIKDILDEAPEQGIRLRDLNLRFLFAAEAFSEKFRDYVAVRAGIKDVCRDTSNVYGTADLGTMACETPGAIFIRRFAARRKSLFKRIFGSIEKTPTLTQYNPLFVNFEADNGELLITGDNSIPLVRYAIGDNGGVRSFSQIEAAFDEEGINLRREAKNAKIPLYELPFVYVYERKDLATTLYGLKVYPEMVKETLLHPSLVSFITGRFTLLTHFDKKQNQFLEINFELKKNSSVNARRKRLVLKKVTAALRKNSSEYRELSDHLGRRALPKLVFWPNGHETYFRTGTKQQWVKKRV